MPHISLSHLTKRYIASQPPAVNNVSLDIEDGDFMCILGPSGCGKSTILRMISGLENISDGEIIVDGRIIDSVARGQFVPPEKRGIGLVFQSYALWPHMTVADNIEFGLKLQKTPAKQRKVRLAEMMHKLRIEGLEKRYPAQLSGGQQQRVALARTLAVSPDILLLDEPLSNLDAALRLSMRAELSRLHREFGTTIVFVTHDQWEAMTLATRIAVIKDGQLQQLGTPDDIYERPANRFVAEFIGNPPINLVSASHDAARLLVGTENGQLPGEVEHVGVRPEGFRIEANPGEGALPVKITDILPTGGIWIIEMETHEHAEGGKEQVQFVHTTQTPPAWKSGDSAFLHLRDRDNGFHFFFRSGERMTLPDALQTARSRPLVGAA